jgi:hypothetical protein
MVDARGFVDRERDVRRRDHRMRNCILNVDSEVPRGRVAITVFGGEVEGELQVRDA